MQFLFIGRVVIDTSRIKISSLATFPILRTLFLDGDEDFGAKECDTTVGTFAEITDRAKRKNVCDRWGRGIDIAYRSSDFLWETQSPAA